MATFAKLDENNVVIQLVKIGNDVPTANGVLGENDMHIDGETYCQNLFGGGTWKQTSFSNSFRKQVASIGGTYDSINDVFISAQPYESWSLDENFDWQPPIPEPNTVNVGDITLIVYSWDEENQRWRGRETFESTQIYIWNPETLSWSEEV